MKKIFYLIIVFNSFCCLKLFAQPNKSQSKENFITVEATQFIKNNQPYTYIGANLWYGMHLGYSNKKRLQRELNHLQDLGITNLRVMALTEGPDTEPYRITPANNYMNNVREDITRGLDFLLVEMKKRNMHAVICLSNFWPWSGGFAQYLQWAESIDTIPYPMDTTGKQDWDLYQQITSTFYSDSIAQKIYKNAISKIINRKNSITNVLYKEDPTIMSWQLCNEPRGMKNVSAYLKWIDESAKFIKQLDSNHLVSVGSEGLTTTPEYNGLPFIETHQSKFIDYTTAHLWVQNWNLYDPKNHSSTYDSAIKKATNYIDQHIELSVKLNKPFVLEEFGISRDEGSFDITSSTKVRDDYFNTIFNIIYQHIKNKKASGANFWAWSGEGRPQHYAGWWKNGDDFTGDPPHELQGWYSVYNSDTTTLSVIKKYNDLLKDVK
jgi:mannan endo-1,4-beta-mannosidase